MSMKGCVYFAILSVLFLSACAGDGAPFETYERQFVGRVPIGSSVTKQIVMQNPDTQGVQHITQMNFEAGTNMEGHFRIDKVELGGVVVNPRDRDITIPAGSILQVYVTYQPLNLDTTLANYGGWLTGVQERYMPGPPGEEGNDKDKEDGAVKAMSRLIGKEDGDETGGSVDLNDSTKAIHRAILTAIYDKPGKGLVQIELVGQAEAGPNGETSAAGGGTGECPSDSGTLCYKGGFAMALPDLMTTGPKQLKMSGPAVFKISGNNVEMDMGKFPTELLVLKGNGPGEPLEGKPINAISIVISGAEGVTAKGTFDGTKLEVNDIAFRIRVVLGEITEQDITPGLQASVDFNVKGLTLKTIKPLTNGSITLSVETNLAKEPSGNPMFDQFLGGARVVVTMDGSLTIN